MRAPRTRGTQAAGYGGDIGGEPVDAEPIDAEPIDDDSLEARGGR
ncbi:hypothetical protein GCM10009740_28990 [Terrabacter terrae]|uniref:Uncharacterized protein n=1 Tax=Terrabacter terrae TaxID=318434 RepID=A0ABN2UEU6_9MICO